MSARQRQTITLFEHQTRRYDDLFPVDFGERGINAKKQLAQREYVLQAMEQLNTAAGQEIIHLGRSHLRTGAWVGMLRAGAYTIQILPKLDAWNRNAPSSDKQTIDLPSSQRAARNLLTLLAYAFDLPLVTQNSLTGMETQPFVWFEMLIGLFVTELARQARAGFAHAYTPHAENLPMLRGRWDIQRQILHPNPVPLRFAVRYDAFGMDTPLNQIFRAALERIAPLCTHATHQAHIRELRRQLQRVTPLAQITPDLLERITFNRQNSRFQTAFQLARMFLTGLAPRPITGTFPTSAFLFDMNVLFERFVAGFLLRHQPDILPRLGQPMQIIAQAQGMPIYLGESDGHGVTLLRPDLLFQIPGHPAPWLITDTKYKQVAARRDPSADDLYQMVAYAVRLHCPCAMLLYPQTPGSVPVRQIIHIPTAGLAVYRASINLHANLLSQEMIIQEMREIFHWVAQPRI